jgi:hypothetical protein
MRSTIDPDAYRRGQAIFQVLLGQGASQAAIEARASQIATHGAEQLRRGNIPAVQLAYYEEIAQTLRALAAQHWSAEPPPERQTRP